MASLVNRAASAAPTAFKRFVHRAASFEYLRRNPEYPRLMMLDTGEAIKNSPKLVSRILSVESAMARRGLVPLVHAIPASGRVPFSLYKAVQGSPEHVQPLRSPLDPAIKDLEESWKEVPQSEDRRAKPNLISASYGLFSNTELLESAASWGFRNHFGNAQTWPMQGILRAFFQDVERTFGKPVPGAFKERAFHLILEYNRLKVGSFFVLGIPKHQLSRWVYDSTAYNVPTMRPVEKVVSNPEMARDGHFATIICSKELLHPRSELIAVEANDAHKVERFCRGMEFSPPTQFEEYKRLIGPPSSFEEEEEVRLKALDEKLRDFSEDFQFWLRTGEEPLFVEDFQSQAGDFPALPP